MGEVLLKDLRAGFEVWSGFFSRFKECCQVRGSELRLASKSE